MGVKFILLLFSLTAVVLVSGCTQYGKEPVTESAPVEGNVIEITSYGFSPDTLIINAGATVIYVNKDTLNHWPASDPHPGHNQYPETGGCIASKFDACRALSRNDTFSFKFNQTGTWTYHDHLNSKLTGTIVVQ
ncbi:MAG: hypothetical protein WC568_10365 [Candidatus Methanoperedens sp.]